MDDVSFELRRGECLGLIGHNGAGKSTLLKMLNGLINPDKGKITMKGRIGALIELGAGFNPILTGRENVFNNGAVLGFTQKEIAAKYKAIVEFAELEEFMDTPVQNYSSGMKVRLGFAVAAQMEPDVLIIDEVLAVGDVGFKTKCFNTIVKMIEKTSIIFVSHSMPQISRICERLVFLKNGVVFFQGSDLVKGINLYFDSNLSQKPRLEKVETGISMNEINGCSLENFISKDISIHSEGDINIQMALSLKEPISFLKVGLIIGDQDLKQLIAVRSDKVFIESMNDFNIDLKIPNIPLSIGTYYMSVSFHEVIQNKEHNLYRIIANYKNAITLKVVGNSESSYVPMLWSASVNLTK
ncbi:MAG: ABC transporter ATP-binding protein [Cyclobacteriaceae bacterium]